MKIILYHLTAAMLFSLPGCSSQDQDLASPVEVLEQAEIAFAPEVTGDISRSEPAVPSLPQARMVIKTAILNLEVANYMNQESTFRIIFIAIFVMSFSISIYFRHQARKQSGKIPRQAESKAMIVLRLLLALPLYLSMIAYMIEPQWMAWSALALPTWLRWLGAGLGLAMIPLLYWLFHSLGKNVSETILTKESHEMVTHGPYRWVRHPLYSTASFGILGLGLLAANWLMLLMIFLIMIMLPALVSKEEAQLIEKFGNAYREYMKQTGRFLPRVSPL